MKQQPTKEQVLDALREHQSISAAAKALGIKHPVMMKLLKRYGIKTIPANELPPLPCKPLFEQKMEVPLVECTAKEMGNSFFRTLKRFFGNGKKD